MPVGTGSYYNTYWLALGHVMIWHLIMSRSILVINHTSWHWIMSWSILVSIGSNHESYQLALYHDVIHPRSCHGIRSCAFFSHFVCWCHCGLINPVLWVVHPDPCRMTGTWTGRWTGTWTGRWSMLPRQRRMTQRQRAPRVWALQAWPPTWKSGPCLTSSTPTRSSRHSDSLSRIIENHQSKSHNDLSVHHFIKGCVVLFGFVVLTCMNTCYLLIWLCSSSS